MNKVRWDAEIFVLIDDALFKLDTPVPGSSKRETPDLLLVIPQAFEPAFSGCIPFFHHGRSSRTMENVSHFKTGFLLSKHAQ